MFTNTYTEYGKIIDGLKNTGRLCSFAEAARRDSFIVLRHDIEFSISKALAMAAIETEHGVKATYFVQIGCNAYNVFSDESRAALKLMSLAGHEIGLHYRQGSFGMNGKSDETAIRERMEMLSEWLDVPVKVFSTHRPKADTDYDEYFVPGALNAYAKEFFTRTDNPDDANVKYISDSKYRWNYGYPSAEAISGYEKAQILIHPFQWAEEPFSMAECFAALEVEKAWQLKETFRKEYQRYREVENANV